MDRNFGSGEEICGMSPPPPPLPGFIELSVISERFRTARYRCYIESLIIHYEGERAQRTTNRTLSPIGFAFITYRR